MPNLNIPDEGLTVPGPSLQVPDEKPNARAAYPASFAMKINLTERFLEELSSGKQTSIQLNTGKGSGRMTLQVGSNQFEYMHTTELFHNELYRQSEDDSDTVVPLGLLKDKLELLEVVEKKSVDADLLALKQQMEALQKQKDKKSVQLVSNPSKLGPELSGRRGLIAAKKAGILTTPSMKTKVNKRTKFSSSMPTSPALTAATSPAGKDVTSAPSKPKSFRNDALFLPLIHLLALGPEREQALAMKTHTDLDRCSSLVIQVANRDVSGRWKLFDEMYKELDVWKFKYPKREMREQAIENAEDAFDRLKLPEEAPQWEMLRKPEDRGKPRPPRQPRRKPEAEAPKKKLPAAAASPALPPTIKISKNESAASSPALAAEPMTRSVSQPVATTVAKARGNAESVALKKILGNKKTAKPKAPTTKTTSREKKSAAASSNSTSTSTPSTNPPASKQTPTLASKSPALPSAAPAKPKTTKKRIEYKSAETIEDSDSDSDRMDIDVPARKAPSGSASTSSSSSAQPLYKKSMKASAQTEARSQGVSSKRPPSVSATAASPPTTNGHRRNTSQSASPAKPSPLGSSPPMTASEVRQSSTASSSPLSSIATPDDVSTPMMDLHTSYTSVPVATPKSSAEKAASRPRYIPERGSTSPQPKRKADEGPAVAGRPRKRVLSSASDSDGGRKRKEAPEERPTVARKAPKTSATADVTKARKAPVKTVANGVTKKEFEEVRQQRRDLPRVTYASSTTSTTSNVSVSSSDTSSRGGRSRYRYAEENIALLAKYKRLHDDYRTRYEKVRQDPNPPEDRVKQKEAGPEDVDIPELLLPPPLLPVHPSTAPPEQSDAAAPSEQTDTGEQRLEETATSNASSLAKARTKIQKGVHSPVMAKILKSAFRDGDQRKAGRQAARACHTQAQARASAIPRRAEEPDATGTTYLTSRTLSGFSYNRRTVSDATKLSAERFRRAYIPPKKRNVIHSIRL
ncbi:hypothetical protein Dda_2529 [Drechslerella dactyloides]|uniref:E3 ubiquitin-protein ligase n=1 Tax=Drechslerella dactyloides TaxID=74499 RepID=A0AAD6NJG9_DREDA|nr:hypothetical protein Dda_2529 [Drechslerella dactyloides]